MLDEQVEEIVAAISRLDNEQLKKLFDRLGILEKQAKQQAPVQRTLH
jgi:hypothetical protein